MITETTKCRQLERPRECLLCGEMKRADEFYRNARKAGGREIICKACRKVRQLSTPADIARRLLRKPGINLTREQVARAFAGNGNGK